MDNNPLLRLRSRGQSVWLDDIHRRMLSDGSLARLIEEDGLAGLTSNPAIFAAAITQHPEYQATVAQLLPRVANSTELYEAIVLDDIGRAADLFRPVYDRAGGRDGFVSLEVSPHLANDTQATIAEGRRLWGRLERPNVMIKVPGTQAGLGAISALIGAGVNVNVTLLFSPARYQAVAEAYMSGLELRARGGGPLASIASVASFFLSRIDTLVDRTLDEHAGQGRGEARALRGRAATACAARAYDVFQRSKDSERWRALAAQGARPQRLLWASTSTKDPHYSDVKYVEELISAETVNTMPLQTIEAYREHGKGGAGLEPHRADAGRVVRELAKLGIDLEQVAQQLETEGVRKFVEPFDQLQQWLDERRRS
jgi:transaldolase